MQTPLNFLKVLYIEDDDATRSAMSRFLTRRVGMLTTAIDADEGLEQYYSTKPDIVIADLLLPGDGGVELIKKIRETDKRCKIIVTTTVSNLETIKNVVDYKIECYILKPIKIDEFEKQLNNIAENLAVESTHLNQKLYFNSHTHKNEIEMVLKAKLSKLLKEKIGKGPRMLTINFYEESIELIICGAFSQMDTTLLSEKKNSSIVERNRRLLYEIIAREIETTVNEAVDACLCIKKIDIDADEFTDRIVLEVVQSMQL